MNGVDQPAACVRVTLISCYEMGRQPFGLASPAAWLRDAGADVTCVDLSVDKLEPETVADADLIAFYVPMHTATRIASGLVATVRSINPGAHLCFYGLYASINEAYLRELGAQTILGGEFETGLVELAGRLAAGPDSIPIATPPVSLQRQRFRVPDRRGLPGLDRYAGLHTERHELKTVGYTEATRGCKHLCRHCPIVPVYDGRFFVVQPEVVLEDIGNLVDQGAEHITFGDPDFLNGPRHAMRIVHELRARWPGLTYDVTIKVGHLRKHAALLPDLARTGCAFVTSAVEAVDDEILERFEKKHTREDFIQVASEFRRAGLVLNPTFVTFTPWTTLENYADLLCLIDELGLVDNTAPIQFGIRLLITSGSRLLDLPEVRELVERFDSQALVYPWRHPDERMDTLHKDVLELVERGAAAESPRREVFERIRSQVERELGRRLTRPTPRPAARVAATIPYLTEPWYC